MTSSADAYKYWASNRGWISTKFALKNPVTHFLNLYKKKQPQSKPQKSADEASKYFSSEKRKMPTEHSKKISSFQTKNSIEPETIKPQTAPHNYTINSCVFLGEQIQQKSKTIHQPKRNRSLHVKKTKKLQEEIKDLKDINNMMAKIKEQNETSHYSQKNFKATNCGRYKPQMIFLKPHIRASTANMKMNTSVKAHEQFERRKTTIYKEINKSMEVDSKIREYENTKRATSVSHYQPIEYMTEYGEDSKQNEESRNENGSGLSKTQKFGQTFRKKPNLSVLRQKLNIVYNMQDHKDKPRVGLTQVVDLSFDRYH